MSSALRTAVEDRDCAFEVVGAWDAEAKDEDLHADEIHLQDYGKPDGTALCGASGVVTKSHHETKRRRITCAECLMAHHDHAC